ncbi:MAG: hypothetical protein ACP5PT_04470 [Brevinematia bacterium]
MKIYTKIVVILFLLLFSIEIAKASEFFYEEMSIDSYNKTNFSRTYVKYPLAKIERTMNDLVLLYNLENGSATVVNTKKKEVKMTTIYNFLKDLSDRINGFIRFGKTFVGEIKISYSGEKTNIRGFNCVKLVDNFGGYYYITTDLINYKTNFDIKLFNASGIEYNYENFATLFGLKELTLDERSKYYFLNGYSVENLQVIRTVFFVQSNFTYITRVGFKVDDSVFELKTNGYRIIK